jgi:hypothetical protein
MSWRDLLQKPEELVTLPWIGGRVLRTLDRTFKLDGGLPAELGWYDFRVTARSLRLAKAAEPSESSLGWVTAGYLVGDRLIADGVRVETDPAKLISCSERVHLIEPGLGRFVRVSAGRPHEDGPLVYRGQEMPLGPEELVLQALLDEAPAVDGVPGVVPALDAAFRFETWRRAETERVRVEERLRREREEQERIRQEKLAQVRQQMGTGEGRREMAVVDFAEAARSALAVGGATYLDHRVSRNRGEMVVQFRLGARRYECTCDAKTLRIIDAGVCLTDHDTGVKGDRLFTLESFPSVILEAIDLDKLVVWRHLD